MSEAEKACEEGTEEYESGLDDGPLLAARRRGAASDDEEGGGGSKRGSPPPSTVLGSESDESSGQGAAELYDEEEVSDSSEEEEDVEYEDVREESEVGVGGGETGVANGEVSLAADEGKYEDDEAAVEGDEEEEAAMKREEVKKASDSEFYAVPTAGDFYEHDNRFQAQEDGNHGYQRRIFGGQKIWCPKEEAVWAHDLFNEINFRDNKHDNVSTMPSVDNGYFHGSKSYYDTKSVENVKQTQFHSYYGNAKGYNDERNMYSERSSRTNQSCRTTSRISSAQNNTSQDAEVSYNAGAEKHSSQTSLQHEQTRPCNQIFGSNTRTSSAPAPFYSATRSSHRELPFMQREKARRVTFNKLFSSAVHKAHLEHEKSLPCKQTFGSNISSAPPPSCSSRLSHQRFPFIQREKAQCAMFSKLFLPTLRKAHNSLTPKSHPIFRRKAFVPSASGEHGTAVNSHRIVPIDAMPHSALHPMSTSHNYNGYSKYWKHSRDIAEPTRHCTLPRNIVYEQRSVQGPILPTPRASAKIFVQKVTSINKIQSHPEITLVSSSGDGEATARPDPNSSVVVSAVTGHDDMNEAERTCLLDGGSLVLGDTGARGSILDDPGSSNTLPKLPVMLLSGLHPRGPGFPSDAMVLPEILDQRRGGNSEMRLMACESRSPILTGATGVQEGAIGPPYFGSNCFQPSELASSLASPSDHGVKKDPTLTSQDSISLTYQKIPAGVVGHEFVHLQNRTRRYSEMSFAL